MGKADSAKSRETRTAPTMEQPVGNQPLVHRGMEEVRISNSPPSAAHEDGLSDQEGPTPATYIAEPRGDLNCSPLESEVPDSQPEEPIIDDPLSAQSGVPPRSTPAADLAAFDDQSMGSYQQRRGRTFFLFLIKRIY